MTHKRTDANQSSIIATLRAVGAEWISTTRDPGTLSFTLPLGVSVNHMYAHTVRGVHLTDAAREFKNAAGVIVRNAAQLAGGWQLPTDSPLFLHMQLYLPSRRRMDISNIIKITEDAIAEALGFDDRMIHKLVVERAGIDRQNPRCEALIGAL
jgi:Holliday junction resolvase RusA-like endonuclease